MTDPDQLLKEASTAKRNKDFKRAAVLAREALALSERVAWPDLSTELRLPVYLFAAGDQSAANFEFEKLLKRDLTRANDVTDIGLVRLCRIYEQMAIKNRRANQLSKALEYSLCGYMWQAIAFWRQERWDDLKYHLCQYFGYGDIGSYKVSEFDDDGIDLHNKELNAIMRDHLKHLPNIDMERWIGQIRPVIERIPI
jgi:hypothetical protein